MDVNEHKRISNAYISETLPIFCSVVTKIVMRTVFFINYSFWNICNDIVSKKIFNKYNRPVMFLNKSCRQTVVP
jgi:hypothetical protein